MFAGEDPDAEPWAAAIRAALRQPCGFAPWVGLLTPGDLARAVEQDPFPDAETDLKGLHALFLAARPVYPDLYGLEAVRKVSKRFKLVDRGFYLHALEGIGRSKRAAQAEGRLGVAMTVRNGRTVLRVRDMAGADEPDDAGSAPTNDADAPEKRSRIRWVPVRLVPTSPSSPCEPLPVEPSDSLDLH